MPHARRCVGARRRRALWLPAFRYRIDAATCASWPSLVPARRYAVAYVAAVALLAAAWLRALRLDWSLGRALAVGALVHAVAMVAPPFASNDPLFYAAVGHSMATRHASAATPLSLGAAGGRSLPDGAAGELARRNQPVRRGVRSARARRRQRRRRRSDAAAAPLPGALGAGARRWRRGWRAWRSVRARRRCCCCRRSRSSTAASTRTTTRTLRSPSPRSRWRCRVRVAVAVAVAAAVAVAVAVAVAARRSRRRPGIGGGARGQAVGGAVARVRFCCAWRSQPIAHAPARLDRRRRRCRRGRRRRGRARRRPAHLARARRLHRPRRRSRPRPTRTSRARGKVCRARSSPTSCTRRRCRSRSASSSAPPAASGSSYAAYRAARDRAPLVWAAITLFVYYLCLHAFLQAWYLLPLLRPRDAAARLHRRARSASSSSA